MNRIIKKICSSWLLGPTQCKNRWKEVPGKQQDMNRECKKHLIKQLEMNERAWDTLQNNGVTTGDEFCLNFKFTAHNHACSEALKDFISQKTDYTAHITSEGQYKTNWVVEGATKPVKLSMEIIDQWVSQMVKLGLQYDCTFSGWWIWKYEDFACPGSPPAAKNLGSITEKKPTLIKRLIRMTNK